MTRIKRRLLRLMGALLFTVLMMGCGQEPHDTELSTRSDRDVAANLSVLLDVFPAAVVDVPKEKQGTTKRSAIYTPSESLWGKHLKEETVFHYELTHEQDPHNSYSLRLGKGGQLYSLRGAFGESIPPQGLGNPWNDEVWQFVAVCSKYNGLAGLTERVDLPAAVIDRIKSSPYENSYFIHNSGAYIPSRVDSGEITVSCDVMINAASPGRLDIMMRDISEEPWKTFGTLSVSSSGVRFNKQQLLAARTGVWHTLSFAFDLDQSGTQKGTVTVSDPDSKESTHTVALSETPISVFNWIGLSANGTGPGVVHVDDLSVKRVTDTATEWPIQEDFEDYTPGQRFGYVVGRDTEKGADALVSDSAASSGQHSLEIRDAAGLPGSWQPMVKLGVETSLSGSLYCPLLGEHKPIGGRSYRSVNWGMVPQLKTMHRSPLLYYVQTRDVGDGVIEITYVVHNFSARDDVVFDWLNAPWGGTRVSSLPYHYVSAPDGTLRDRNQFTNSEKDALATDVRNTGGWNLSCVTESDDSPSLALVFGRDKHLEDEREKSAQGQAFCQLDHSIYRDWTSRIDEWEKLKENTWRNYDVAVVIPRFNLAPGTTIWYRSFLVVNRKDRAIALAKSLVDKIDYGLRVFEPATTPMVPVSLPGQKPFKLFAHPVPGSRPLFLIENVTTDRDVITSDPYIFVPQEKLDLGIPAELPGLDYHRDALGYSLGENNSKWKRLLGYGYVDTPEDDSFARLSSQLSEGAFPEPNQFHQDLWVKTPNETSPQEESQTP